MSQIFTDDDVNTLANGAPLTVDRVRFIESLLLAKLAGVEAGPFGYVLKGREWPNQVFYPADYMPSDLNNWDEVYTLPKAAAKVVQAVLDEREDFELMEWLSVRERFASVRIDFDRTGAYRQHRVTWYVEDYGWASAEGQSIREAVRAARSWAQEVK